MASNEEVVLKISTSFKRLCGGGIKTRTIPGCNCYSSLLKFNQSSEEKKNEWLSHLESLAEKSLSYPNGTLYGDDNDNDNNNDNDNPNTNIKRNNPSVDDVLNIGKPHDAEIKLALSFFHRYRHKCIKYCSTQSLSTDNGENVIPPLEITSDTGLTRSIQNPMEFAKLMVNDLEDWIWHERQKNDRNSHQLYSIRIDQSGIICMVTPKRVEYLHSIGRLSCSRCTKWVKGEKGLWWHCQKEHNLDHSIATAIASSSTGVNEFSMVVYRNQSEDNVARTRTFDAPSSNACVPIEKKTDPYFQMIKDGDLQQLVSFLEKNEGYNVITYNDRNGASALHWAAGCGHIDIVKFLIEQHKCFPDQGQKGKRSFRNRTPLHWACRNGHLGIVKYFVEECNVDIDAITIDGTTAFCWSCWQGHEDVMSYLHSKGANTAAINSFGCNAVLWSAQSTVSGLLAIEWLESIGSNMDLINSNGHGILHKSAQRGKDGVCRWIIETYRFPMNSKTRRRPGGESGSDVDLLCQICPDKEGCCPSDLAGMAGFKSLANWLVAEEQKIGMNAFAFDPTNCPLWLREGVDNSRHKTNMFGLDGIFEKNAGVKKICAHIATRKRGRDDEK